MNYFITNMKVWEFIILASVVFNYTAGKYESKPVTFRGVLVDDQVSFNSLHRSCENTTMEITCNMQQKIRINNAFYGKEPYSSICGNNYTDTTLCYYPFAVTVLTQKCNNKQSCTIFVNSTDFPGDLCPDKAIYLAVDYTCIFETLNQNNMCDPRYNYRVDNTTTCTDMCPGFNCVPVVEPYVCICNQGFSRDPYTNTCVGNAFCPKDTAGKYVSPQFFTTRGYFVDNKVSFNSLHRSCENTTMEITCNMQQKIRINNAFYGKEPYSSICGNNYTDTTLCYYPFAVTVLTQKCNNKQSCTIFVNSTDFPGDLCPDKAIYLAVDYTCIFEPLNQNNMCDPRYNYRVDNTTTCTDMCPGFNCVPVVEPYVCICNQGFSRDPYTNTCVGNAFCPKGNPQLNHQMYNICANRRQSYCTDHRPNRVSPVRCDGLFSTNCCLPGYICQQGYFWDNRKQACVIYSKCS